MDLKGSNRTSGVPWILAVALALGAAAACAADDDRDDSPADPAGEGGAGPGGGGPATTGSAGGGNAPPEEVPCPYVGEPLVNASSLVPCPTSVCGGGGHCVPRSLVSAEQQAVLADCDADNECVPDPFIETKGNYVPPTCESFMGVEGRCLSTCFPDVAAQASILPQDICAPNEVCAPCYDPFTQEDTGACHQSCDPGPVEPPAPALPSCCSGNATCIPTDLIPDEDEESLAQDDCPTGDGTTPPMLCVPNEMLDPEWEPTVMCETSELLQWTYGEEYWEGGCMPECLGAVQGPGTPQTDCPDGYRCAPCWDPENYGQLTGACPWKGG